MRTEPIEGAGGPLAAVRLFHALHEKWRQAGALSLEDSRMLLLLRDLFEPERVTAHGLVRRPIELPVHRAGVISAAGERQRVEVVRIASAASRARCSAASVAKRGARESAPRMSRRRSTRASTKPGLQSDEQFVHLPPRRRRGGW